MNSVFLEHQLFVRISTKQGRDLQQIIKYLIKINFKNYGDEIAGIAALFPQKFSHMGLSEQDFNKLRGRDEVNFKMNYFKIKSIFESIGFKYGLGKFQGIYNRAK